MSHSVEAQSPLQQNVPEQAENSFLEYDQTNKTEIKEETTNDIFEELEINAKTKCGEVFTSYRGTLVLICAFCNGEFDKMHLFGVHIREQHECQLTRQQFDTEIVTVGMSPPITKAEPEETAENKVDNVDSFGESGIQTAKEVPASSTELYPSNIAGQKLTGTRRNLKRTECRLDDLILEETSKRRRVARKSVRTVHQSETSSSRFPLHLKDRIISEAIQELHKPLTEKLPIQPDEKLDSTVGHCTQNSTEFISVKYIFKSDNDSDGSQDCYCPDERSSKASESDVGADTNTPETFPCKLCNRTYRSKRSLNRHLRKPHTPNDDESISQEFVCVPCNKQFKSKRAWQRHQRNHKLEENPEEELSEQKLDVAPDDAKVPHFHCDLCNNNFRTKFSLYVHSDTHDTLPAMLQDNLDFLKCKFCNQQLPKYGERKKHEKTHTSARPYECPYCEKGFSSGYNRKIHIRSHTGKFQFECPHCPKVCTNKTDLKRHVVRHLNIRNFGCELCDKRFYRRFELARHMRTHTKERPYVCEDCGATYPVLAQLKDHQLRHKGVKNIKCEICGRLFYSKSVLKVHMPTHFDEKPFECDVCGRKFSRAKAMQKHQKLHSGEKKYVCNICGKAYAQDSGLYAHKKTHGANVA